MIRRALFWHIKICSKTIYKIGVCKRIVDVHVYSETFANVATSSVENLGFGQQD